jgi:hypothetical protein
MRSSLNPPENGLASRAATSPALFNRCVLDWFGDWSDQAFYQVGMEFTRTIDLDLPSYTPCALPYRIPRVVHATRSSHSSGECTSLRSSNI